MYVDVVVVIWFDGIEEGRTHTHTVNKGGVDRKRLTRQEGGKVGREKEGEVEGVARKRKFGCGQSGVYRAANLYE